MLGGKEDSNTLILFDESEIGKIVSPHNTAEAVEAVLFHNVNECGFFSVSLPLSKVLAWFNNDYLQWNPDGSGQTFCPYDNAGSSQTV